MASVIHKWTIYTIDCQRQLWAGSINQTKYLAQQFLCHMIVNDPNSWYFDLIQFDGASNVQKGEKLKLNTFFNSQLQEWLIMLMFLLYLKTYSALKFLMH